MDFFKATFEIIMKSFFICENTNKREHLQFLTFNFFEYLSLSKSNNCNIIQTEHTTFSSSV